MEPSAWSQNDLSGQPIMEQDELETNPIDTPRQSSMFRSYRNLSASAGSYDSRIFLRPCLPPPTSAPYRSQHLSNDVPPFWLHRSSSVRNLSTTNSESMISLGAASPTQNPEVLNNPEPSADSYPQLDHPLYDIPHAAVTERENFLSRLSHPNQTRFAVDFDVVQRGLSDSHLPHATVPRLTSQRTNVNPVNDQPLVINTSNPWNAVPNQSGVSNLSMTSLAGSRDNVQRTLNVNRPVARSASVSVPTRTSTSSQTRLPSNLRLRRALAENRRHNAVSTTETSGSRTVNLASDSHRPSNITTYRSAPPVQSRQTSTERTPNRRTTASSTSQPTGRNADRRIRVVRQPAVLVQRAINQPSDIPSSASGASSVEDIHVPSVVTPDTRSVYNNSLIQRPRNPSPDESEQSKLAEQPELEANGVSPDNDWRTGCPGSQTLWHRLLQTERFADVWFVVGGASELDPGSRSPSLASLDPGAPGGPTSMQVYGRSTNRQAELIPRIQREHSTSPPSRSTCTGRSDPEQTVSNLICSYNSLDEGLVPNEELDLNSDLDDAITGTERSNGDAGQKDSTPDEQPVSTSCPLDKSASARLMCDISMNRSVTDTTGTSHDFIRQVNVQSYDSSSDSSNQEISAPDTTTSRAGEVEGHDSPSHRLATIQHTRCQRFAAHRLILAAASPVFEAMFYGPVAEMHTRHSEQPTDYYVPDIHPRAFQVMLRYIYTDEIQLDDDPDVVFYVLYAAKKYMLAPLGRRCVEHLKELITASNVCLMLDRSMFFDEEDLTRRCWHVIDVLAPHVLNSAGLLEMDADNLIALLQRDTLNCKESEVFAAVRRWAGAECVRLGLRDVLSNRAQVAAKFLPLVRFPTMTLNDFAQKVAYSGFLSLEMVRDLFVQITTNEYAELTKEGKTQLKSVDAEPRTDAENDHVTEEPGLPTGTELDVPSTTTQPEAAQPFSSTKDGSILFPSEPRRGPKLWRCSRFSRTGKHAVTPSAGGSHQHSVSFQVSAPIFLSGIGVYGSTQVGERLTVTVELKHIVPRTTSNTRSCASVGTQFHGSVDSPTEQQPRRQHALPRSSSLLEVARYDWTGRPHVISRRVSSQNPEPIVLTMSGESNRSPARGFKKRKKGSEDADTQATAKVQIMSDGSTRVYDVTFPCPVKLYPDQRYLLSVQTFQYNRPKSVSAATLTTLNSSTFYIGFFGRPEVRVRCGGNSQEKTSPTTHTKRTLYRSAVGGGAMRASAQRVKRLPPLRPDISAIQDDDSEEISFRFWETPEGKEHGEVDRGFLPELLFYTCS